jgi:hypothetical protein
MYAREVLDSSKLDMTWLNAQYASGVRVQIEDHWEGYWEVQPLQAAVGLAYSSGQFIIKASYKPGEESFFGEIVAHEVLGHGDWFRLPKEARAYFVQWATEGMDYDPYNWYENPAEAYAEQSKVALGMPQHIVYGVRTHLRLLPTAVFLAWRAQYPGLKDTPPGEPTTTTLRVTTTTVAHTGKYAPPPGWGYTPATTTTTIQTTTTTGPAVTTTTIRTSGKYKPAPWMVR